MSDDGYLRSRRILGGCRTALRALPRVVKRFQVTGVAECDRAKADTEAGLVHHVKHVGESSVRFADQIPDRSGLAAGTVAALTKVQDRVGSSAVAHLVVQPGQHDIVAFADPAARVDEELGNDEERDTLRTGRTTGNLGKNKMDDVVGEFVIAARYPHLRSEQAITAVAPRFGPGDDVGQR